MNECDVLHPQLSRLAEGEAAPDEAMRVARHVSDCTACRIHLARERWLAAMLDEGLEDPVHVGESFVRAVMDNLPQGPPPAPRRRRHDLKLAGLAGLIALGPALIPRWSLAAGWRFELPGLGHPDLGAAERLFSAFAGLARTIPLVLDAVSGALPPLHVATGFAGLAAVATLAAAAVFGCAATVAAAATTGGLQLASSRRSSSPRVIPSRRAATSRSAPDSVMARAMK